MKVLMYVRRSVTSATGKLLTTAWGHEQERKADKLQRKKPTILHHAWLFIKYTQQEEKYCKYFDNKQNIKVSIEQVMIEFVGTTPNFYVTQSS